MENNYFKIKPKGRDGRRLFEQADGEVGDRIFIGEKIDGFPFVCVEITVVNKNVINVKYVGGNHTIELVNSGKVTMALDESVFLKRLLEGDEE